jgi:hypothetical protein
MPNCRRNRNRSWGAVLALIISALAAAPRAQAQLPPPPPPPPGTEVAPEEAPARRLGVGYKIGNGWGVIGGDVLVQVVDHVALDLQANYLSISDPGGGTATGWGIAPAVQLELRARGSTPYLGAGALYGRLQLGNVTAAGSGAFANLGWHWKWQSGLGIVLGGGLAYLARVRATDGVTTVETGGRTFFNIEAGMRFMFL